MSPNPNEEVKLTLSTLLQNPEGASAIGHAIVAELVRQKNDALDPDANHRSLLPLLKEYTLKLQEFAAGTPIWGGSRANPYSQQWSWQLGSYLNSFLSDSIA